MTIKIFSNNNAKKYVKNSGFITHIEENLTRKEIINYLYCGKNGKLLCAL